MGFTKMTARPRHHQNELALEDFKKNFPAELALRQRLPDGAR